MPISCSVGRLAIASVLPALLAAPEAGKARSLLETVLAALAGFDGGASSLLANLAVSGRDPSEVAPAMAPGDLVLVGYDRLGAPLYAAAGLDSIIITPAVAAAEASGLSAGIYPLTLPLYSAPDGGWALYGATATGEPLPPAMLSLGRIDGSIRMVITDLRSQPLLAEGGPLAAVWGNVAQPGSAPSAITTALGAVNAGQLVTALSVELGTNASAAPGGIESATIARGANSAYVAAAAGQNAALMSVVGQLGGSTTPLAAANVAANMTTTEGVIQVQLSRVSARVGALVTTTIGAVNSGSISGGNR